MIVDCAIYRDGIREAVHGELGDALDEVRATTGSFLWLGMHQPSTDEFGLVSEEFKLHPLAVEDAVHAHQRPKLERYDDTLFIVLKTLRYSSAESTLDIGEIMMFIGAGFVVTVRHGDANPLTAVRKRLEGSSGLLRLGPSSVVHAVLDEIVDTYELIGEELGTDIAALEERVFAPDRTNDAEAIYAVKRVVVGVRSAVAPLSTAARGLVIGELPAIPEEIKPYLRDVIDHVLRVAGQVDSFDDLLTGVLNANLAQVSVRQNEDMRKISAWAAIIAVPTAIAGIYGMNFRHMPELHWRIGYPLVLVVMGTLCFMLHRWFRRSGWL